MSKVASRSKNYHNICILFSSSNFAFAFNYGKILTTLTIWKYLAYLGSLETVIAKKTEKKEKINDLLVVFLNIFFGDIKKTYLCGWHIKAPCHNVLSCLSLMPSYLLTRTPHNFMGSNTDRSFEHKPFVKHIIYGPAEPEKCWI